MESVLESVFMVRKPTSTSLLVNAHQGDSDAIQQLMSLAAKFYALRIETLTTGATGPLNQEDHLDAAQDTLIKLYISIRSGKYVPIINGKHYFHAYASRLLINTIRDYARKRNRLLQNQKDIEKKNSVPDQYIDLMENQSLEEAIDDEAIKSELSGSANMDWWMAVAMQAITDVRDVQTKDETESANPKAQRMKQLAWRGFCLTNLEGNSRQEAIEQLRSRYDLGEEVSDTLTESWLSKNATLIRQQLFKRFVFLARKIYPDASESDLMDRLKEMVHSINTSYLANNLVQAMCGKGDEIADGSEPDVDFVTNLVRTVEAKFARSPELRQSATRLQISASNACRS